MDTDDRNRTVDRYRQRFAKYGFDVQSLNVGDLDKYVTQHRVHASVCDLRGKTVLDIGCGLGLFYDFLRGAGVNCRYIGYDIVPEFVEANRNHYPEALFELRDMTEEGIGHSADVAVICQVFNLELQGSSNEELLFKAISTSFDSVGEALSIDMLSNHVSFREEHLHYYAPDEIFEYALSLTPFVKLRHDYSPHHFTIALYKNGNMT